jgi:cytochrome P450
MATAIQDNLFTEDVVQEPYEYFNRVREEDPVHWNELYELWLITRYDDLVWLIRHPGLFSSAFWRRDPRGPSPSVDEGVFWLGSPRK